MPNRVFLGADDFIHNHHVGDQTGDTVRLMTDQLAVIVARLKAEKRQVLAFIDLTKLGQQDTAARKAAADGLRMLEYDRAAIYGKDPILRYVANLVIRASGQGAKAKYFDSKPEAIAFLKQGQANHE